MLLRIVVALALLEWSLAEYYPDITTASFNGTLVMFAVPREEVQRKLDQFNSQISDPQKHLTLPNRHILPEFISQGQHVVSVSAGVITAKSFVETLPTSVAERYTLQAPTVQFLIPFLSGGDPDGLPVYTLALDSFISTDKSFLQPNLVFPTTQVDEVVLTTHGASIKDGEENFEVSWEEEETCESLIPVVAADIDEFVSDLLVPFDHTVRFALCGGDDVDIQDSDLCRSRDALRSDLVQNRFDVCQTVRPDRGHAEFKNCKLKSYRMESISAKFRSISLLSMENPVPALSDMSYEPYATVGLKLPCME